MVSFDMSLKVFRRGEAGLPLIFAACAGIGLLALGARAEAAEFSGNAALTTDYVLRGITQTQGDPAVQAGFKAAGDSGFYGSVWGSNVEFAPRHRRQQRARLHRRLGRQALSDDWALDVNVYLLEYPSTTVDLDWTELNGTLTYDEQLLAVARLLDRSARQRGRPASTRRSARSSRSTTSSASKRRSATTTSTHAPRRQLPARPAQRGVGVQGTAWSCA